MGEKDKAERMLENYADVFADIVNVLMFGGKRLISPDELVEVDARSQFKAESGKLHEQERDCAKLWRRNGRTLALLGLENQTDIDEDMPLRVFGYEGAGYKSQLLDKTKGQRYPVSTLILYFGKRHWKINRTLGSRISILEEIRPFVNECHVHIREICYLTEEQLAQFESDFGVVAEYFVRSRTNPGYRPKQKTIIHPDAFLKLMTVLTGDHRYDRMRREMEEGENLTMCDVLDYRERIGEERGKAEGEERMSSLVRVLLKDGRLEDLKRVTGDREYRDKLLREYCR